MRVVDALRLRPPIAEDIGCGGLSLVLISLSYDANRVFVIMISLMLETQHWLARLGSSIYTLITGIGGLGVLLLAIGDSSFLSVPEGNDLLIVVLSTGGTWSNMFFYVGITITGSVIGCLLLYYFGRKGGSPLLRRRFSPKSIDRAEKLFERYGILTVVVPSILPPPMPFKIFVLSAGVFRLKALDFLVAVAIGRTIRYSMWGILAVLYGNPVLSFMQNNLNFIGIVLLSCFALVVASIIFCYMFRIKVSRVRKET
jgi:membrane protein DedA with SNARE-associated domain